MEPMRCFTNEPRAWTMRALAALIVLLTGAGAEAQTGMPLAERGHRAARTDTVRIESILFEKQVDTKGILPPVVTVPIAKINLVPPREDVRIQIFADGNLRKSVSEAISQPVSAAEDQGTEGVARLGLARIDPNDGTTWAGLVTVASSVKRISSDFAATVLVPGSGSGFSSGLLEYRRRDVRRFLTDPRHLLKRAFLSDWHFYGSVAASEWVFADTAHRAVTFGFGALNVFTLIDAKVAETEVGLAVEVGPCVRIVGGDVALPRYADYRESTLGTRRKCFFGIEGGMQVRVKEITAGIQLYNLFGSGGNVPGLTRTQLIASVNLRGPLFTAKSDE